MSFRVGGRGFLRTAFAGILIGATLAGCESDLLGDLRAGTQAVTDTVTDTFSGLGGLGSGFGRLLQPPPQDVDIKGITGYALNDFVVTSPGVIAVDAGQRRAELARLDPSRRNALCSIVGAAAPRAPVIEIRGEVGIPPDDDVTTPFALFMMARGAAYFASPDAAEAQAAIAVLKQWAEARAMTGIRDYGRDDTNANSVHMVLRTLVPTLNAWSILRFYPGMSGADRDLIEGWLVELVSRTDVNTGPADGRDSEPERYLSQYDSHRYLRDLVAMQWGILSADDVRFRRGIERFFLALRQMRSDGSLPLEVARGGRALWSQNQAIAALVHIAELAALQGYDLYRVDVQGASIHTGIRYLLDGIDDPRQVQKYANDGSPLAGGSPLGGSSPIPTGRAPVQNLSFLFAHGQRHEMAWLEAYSARLPESANAQRLAALRGGRVIRERPLMSETIGGNATCLFGRESQSLAELKF